MTIYDKVFKNMYPHGLPTIVPRNYNWYAYKNGTCTTFTNPTDAGNHSKAIERFCVNEEEYKQSYADYQAALCAVINEWRKAIREEYSDIPEKVYDLCMSEAYDDAHSEGYGAVEIRLETVIDFARSILSAAND
jgi:hypothetical protein